MSVGTSARSRAWWSAAAPASAAGDGDARSARAPRARTALACPAPAPAPALALASADDARAKWEALPLLRRRARAGWPPRLLPGPSAAPLDRPRAPLAARTGAMEVAMAAIASASPPPTFQMADLCDRSKHLISWRAARSLAHLISTFSLFTDRGRGESGNPVLAF